jgi:Ca2+-binding RTX toxin-like protein
MTIVYTALAQPLIDFLDTAKSDVSGTSSSLNQNLLLGADYYGSLPRIITANYGFDGYMGVPNLNGTDSASQAAAYAAGISWENLDPSLGASSRAYYSGVGANAFLATYGIAGNQADTIPVVFSFPVLASTLNPTDFRVTLNTGEVVTPITASYLPNLEFNERQTVVVSGDWGNRLQPGETGARYPVTFSVVADDTPLTLVGPSGLVSAVGFSVNSLNPYIEGNGPRIVGAKLNTYSDLGEGAPAWSLSSVANSGTDLFGSTVQYRLRIYTSAGFSPDGIGSILPTDYSRYFLIEADDGEGNTVALTQTGVDYQIGIFGSVRILGLADTGMAQSSYNEAYVEDHDNQYDVILTGDAEAIARLSTISMPSSGDYSAVYNPGGPGNDPTNNPDMPFTVASSNQTIAIENDLGLSSFVTYAEVAGSVARDSTTGQPLGTLVGMAVYDTQTGHTINQFIDPNGVLFYASFDVRPSNWKPLNVAYEILNGSTMSVDPSLPIATYKSGGTNSIPGEVWEDGYVPPSPYLINTTRNLQFNESDFIASPGEPDGVTTYVTTTDGYTWAALSTAITAIWPFNEADYSGVSPAITDAYTAGAYVVTPPEGVVKVTANYKGQNMKFYAIDPDTGLGIERYFITDEWGNEYVMHASNHDNVDDVRSAFDASVLPVGWTKSARILTEDLILNPAQGAGNLYHYLVFRDSADNTYHQIGWGNQDQLASQIEGMPIWGGQDANLLYGRDSDDVIYAGDGADLIHLETGNDYVDGGAGMDIAVFDFTSTAISSVGLSADGLTVMVRGAAQTKTLVSIELFAFVGDEQYFFYDELMRIMTETPLFASPTLTGGYLLPTIFNGNASLGLAYELIDSTEVLVLTASESNDFVALQATGNKAIDGLGGDDVLTGTGSLFMTGGAGRDTFFLDGRLAESSWSTITDFEQGEDRLTIWGWRDGVSRVSAAENQTGALGYAGLTLTFEGLRADGTALPTEGVSHAVTFSGLSLADFGAQSVEQLNLQIHQESNTHFIADSTTDIYGAHGYLYIS